MLELREVRFGSRLAPVSLRLDERELHARAFASSDAAALFALIAAGLLRPTAGDVFLAGYDPRIQPVQAKRIAGYVPHEAVPHAFRSFERYVEYRAALWGIPLAQASIRAATLLEQLDGVHEAFAYPLIGALLPSPKILVLDRPQAVYARRILEAAAGCAVLSTHLSERDAQAFAPQAVPV